MHKKHTITLAVLSLLFVAFLSCGPVSPNNPPPADGGADNSPPVDGKGDNPLPVLGGVETNCTDSKDNDGDGSPDSADGDCWIKNGAVFMEDFRPLRTFKELTELAPQLKAIGVQTVELFGLWEHANSQLPGYRWATRDFSKLDPARGSETDFNAFVNTSHTTGLKILPLVVSTVSVTPTASDCANKTCLKFHYDGEGKGGALYRYWKENPTMDIFIKNKDGIPSCDYSGYGFVVDLESPAVLSFFGNFYSQQISARNLDGMRIDTPTVHSCQAGENLYYECNTPCSCPDVSAKNQDPLKFYRSIAKLKNANQVFISEAYLSKPRFSNWWCNFPYYPPETNFDEVARVSEGYEFAALLANNILQNPLTSAQLVEWIRHQPIGDGGDRFRMIRNANGTELPIIQFVSLSKSYYPAVILASTIPGVPKLTDYELFGNKEYDDTHDITPINTPESRREQWKNVLNIRNSNNALKYGDIKNVWKSGEKIFAYSRNYEGDAVVVAINFNGKDTVSYLDLSFLKKGNTLHDKLSSEVLTVDSPQDFQISIPAYGSRILILNQ